MLKALYHLPGLFEFYELYRRFLPLYREHSDWFYDWCGIGSIYGAPEGALWGGGRVGFGGDDIGPTLALLREYGISPRLTFSNSLLTEEHLSDRRCNALCERVNGWDGPKAGVIVHSDLLLKYLKERYPDLYFISSTTKVLTDANQLYKELERDEFRYVVPDFRLNHKQGLWEKLPDALRGKVEFLCNECCSFGCRDRRRCYEAVSRKSLGEDTDFACTAPEGGEGYRFSKTMENQGFIGIRDIRDTYLPMGYTNFKIEGRGLGSAVVLEFLLYYMVKPEHQLRVRETVYLDSMLDLF